jgi:hypothetical protein
MVRPGTVLRGGPAGDTDNADAGAGARAGDGDGATTPPIVESGHEAREASTEPVEMMTLEIRTTATNELATANSVFGGKFKYIGKMYNDRKLYRKVTDQDTWVRFNVNRTWQICSTDDKNANNATGLGHSLEKGTVTPQGKWMVWSGKSYSECQVTLTPSTEVLRRRASLDPDSPAIGQGKKRKLQRNGVVDSTDDDDEDDADEGKFAVGGFALRGRVHVRVGNCWCMHDTTT